MISMIDFALVPQYIGLNLHSQRLGLVTSFYLFTQSRLAMYLARIYKRNTSRFPSFTGMDSLCKGQKQPKSPFLRGDAAA